MTEAPCYILRILKDEWETRLYSQSLVYVGIKRDWNKGSKILFVRKTEGGSDFFVASGTIIKALDLDLLDQMDRKICLENNWSQKLTFERLAKFFPQIDLHAAAIDSIHIRGKEPLHGMKIQSSDAEKIEQLAQSTIVY